jgi:hypothetical protein
MSIRYVYAWTPAVALWVVLIFVIPFLGPIAVLAAVVAVVTALGALVWRLVSALVASVGFVLRRLRKTASAAQGSRAASLGVRVSGTPAEGLASQAQAAAAERRS